jgi:hypothetical protein
MLRLALLLMGLTLAAPAAASAPPKRLFADEAPVRLTIRGPISELARGARSRDPREASLTVASPTPETLPIRLSPRGITRLKRDVCQFPPLRVEFAAPPPATSLFEGQRRLKLVTHCRAGAGFQQHLLLEYAAYKLYNAMTPASFRVRLANIDYVDASGGPFASRMGFFIEEHEDLARRLGGTRAAVGDRIAASQLSRRDAARAALFAYMIGNLDWSMRAGPPDEGCCHNFRLVAAGGPAAGFIPVPYDFDFSGLVGAPYATPPDVIPVSSVRKRHYMGYCMFNAEALAAAAEFRARRAALHAVLAATPGLEEGPRRKAAAYLDGFFADIATDQDVSAKVLKTCLR